MRSLTYYCFLSFVAVAVGIGAVGLAGGDEPESFKVVLLPDTQYYAKYTPETYYAQTQWIADRAVADNIKFAVHLGDIVNQNLLAGWEVASQAHSTLDGAVPYSMLPGNHDMDYSVTPHDTTRYNTYFGPARFEHEPWYGGHMAAGKNDYNYCFFQAADMDFMVLSLEFAPTSQGLQWANNVVSAHPNHRVIVATHFYMQQDGRDTSYGENVWRNFVRNHENIFMVVSGHVCGVAHQASLNNAGGVVHELLCDYQCWPNYGDGWLQTLRFAPGENKIYVEAYSPTLDQYNADPNHTYTLGYDMSPDVPKPPIPKGQVWAENFDWMTTNSQIEHNAGWLGDNTGPGWMSDVETVISVGPNRVARVRARQSPKTGDTVRCTPGSTQLVRPLNEADAFSLSFDVSHVVKEAGYGRLGIGFYDSVTDEKKFQVCLGGNQNWSVNDPTASYESYPAMIEGTACYGYYPQSVLLEYIPSYNPGTVAGAVRLTLYGAEDLGGPVLAIGYGPDITDNNKNDDGTLMGFNVDSIYIAASRYGPSSNSYINSAAFDNLVWKGPPEALATGLIPGDANEDGMVTVADASVLATHWQMQSGATWADGDFNGDGMVNDADASILATHWQEGVEDAAPVPEPAALMLVGIGAVCLAGFVGHRRRRQRC